MTFNRSLKHHKYTLLLRRRHMDQSRPYKFAPLTYVAFSDPHRQNPMQVEFTKNEVVTVWYLGETMQWPERLLRPITFGEFLWFRHPRSLKWMSGKTRGWMAVLIHLFSFVLCAGVATTSLAWAPAPLVIPAVYWYMTWRNFKGLTV